MPCASARSRIALARRCIAAARWPEGPPPHGTCGTCGTCGTPRPVRVQRTHNGASHGHRPAPLVRTTRRRLVRVARVCIFGGRQGVQMNTGADLVSAAPAHLWPRRTPPAPPPALSRRGAISAPELLARLAAGPTRSATGSAQAAAEGGGGGSVVLRARLSARSSSRFSSCHCRVSSNSGRLSSKPRLSNIGRSSLHGLWRLLGGGEISQAIVRFLAARTLPIDGYAPAGSACHTQASGQRNVGVRRRFGSLSGSAEGSFIKSCNR